MRRVHLFILVLMLVMALSLFGIVAVVSQPLLSQTPPQNSANDLVAEVPATDTATATATQTPTETPTLTPTDPGEPTPTNTLVVSTTATATGTPTPWPSRTPIPTNTPTFTPRPVTSSGSGSGSGGAVSYGPVAKPTSVFGFTLVAGPVEYKTNNHFFVVLARITAHGGAASGYRLIGDHQPTGIHFESEPSCNYFCKASGPRSYL